MQNSFATLNAPTLFTDGCDVSRGIYSPTINTLEANTVKDFCSNDEINYVTCKDRYLENRLQEINGLELDLKLRPINLSLPNYIPLLSRTAFKLSSIKCEQDIVGITLDDVFKTGISRRAKRIVVPKTLKIDTEILESNCFKGKKVILFGTGQDALIEKVWFEKEAINFFETISKIGFLAATGINYSLFRGECPVAHAANLKRGLLSCDFFQQAGLKAIPHIYALHGYHVDRWIKWFESNSQINLFTINCQMQKSESEIDSLVQVIACILTNLPHLSVILQGYQTDYLNKLQSFGNRIIVADSGPINLCRSSLIYNFFDEGKSRLHRPDLEKGSIVSQNIQQKTSIIQQILKVEK